MELFIQFLLRLTFGLALGMALCSPQKVTSGYFRNHLYVTLGLATLAALLSRASAPQAFWLAAIAAAVSYLGSVFWLYEKPSLGRPALLIVAISALAAIFLAGPFPPAAETIRNSAVLPVLRGIAPISSGLLLGLTMAAMLLGHWYLNSPSMELGPLRRLLSALGMATLLQMLVSAAGLTAELAHGTPLSTTLTMFLILRWTFGLLGIAFLIWMTSKTLDIPNTQSATGLLYVAVIGTFVGETMALLLSSESLFPL